MLCWYFSGATTTGLAHVVGPSTLSMISPSNSLYHRSGVSLCLEAQKELASTFVPQVVHWGPTCSFNSKSFANSREHFRVLSFEMVGKVTHDFITTATNGTGLCTDAENTKLLGSSILQYAVSVLNYNKTGDYLSISH